MHPAVFTPAQRFPRGQTTAADPRNADYQTWAQMLHPGAVWCHLSDACLAEGAGSKPRLGVQDASDVYCTSSQLALIWRNEISTSSSH